MNAQQHIDLQEFGLSFDVPIGWTGGVEGDYIILGHQTIPGMMILFENKSKDAQALKNLAMQGINDEGVQLNVKGDFKIVSKTRVEGMYEGIFSGTQATAFGIGLINGLGSGINIIILTQSNKFTTAHKTEANKLANSVKFYKAKESDITKQWKNELVGKQLYYGSTGGGGSDVIKIDLCFDGSFYYYTNSHIAFDEDFGSGSANNNENSKGTYKIYSLRNNTLLELIFTNGKVYEYNLSTNEAENTFLDNTRYYIQDSKKCD